MNTRLFLVIVLLVGLNVQGQEVKFKKAFNGKNFKGWVLPQDNIWWSVNEGIIQAKSGPKQKGSILWTKKDYTDFVFETEFLFGDGTIDSGIFLRTDKQQIQIGISGSLKRDMTGSPYIPGRGYPVEANGVKELLKQKDWNTIKVKAQGEVYTVWLNDVQVLNFRSKNVPLSGPIGLQLHPKRDMEIFYRNLKVSKLN